MSSSLRVHLFSRRSTTNNEIVKSRKLGKGINPRAIVSTLRTRLRLLCINRNTTTTTTTVRDLSQRGKRDGAQLCGFRGRLRCCRAKQHLWRRALASQSDTWRPSVPADKTPTAVVQSEGNNVEIEDARRDAVCSSAQHLIMTIGPSGRGKRSHPPVSAPAEVFAQQFPLSLPRPSHAPTQKENEKYFVIKTKKFCFVFFPIGWSTALAVGMAPSGAAAVFEEEEVSVGDSFCHHGPLSSLQRAKMESPVPSHLNRPAWCNISRFHRARDRR